MMPHFAYPNVLPKRFEFIGCGRYTIFTSESSSKSSYQEITETPNTPNKTALEHSLQLLAPDSFDSSFSIFEKKDQEDRVYQGDSLDLAYFLAHINRSRTIKIITKGDIWCTGVIQVHDSQPVLRKVDQVGFNIKLASYLSLHCHDKVFLVPAANLTKELINNARDSNTNIVSLNQLRNFTAYEFSMRKTIIKVLPNELPILIEFIFGVKAPKKNRNLRPILAAGSILFFVGLIGWLFFYEKEEEQTQHSNGIVASLENGEFSTVMNLMRDTSSSDPFIKRQKKLLETPIHIDIKFQYRLAEKNPSDLISTDSSNLNNLILSNRDFYRFRIQSLPPHRDLYVYVFQMDESGNLDILFPNPTLGGENPIKSDQWPLNIPPNS